MSTLVKQQRMTVQDYGNLSMIMLVDLSIVDDTEVSGGRER